MVLFGFFLPIGTGLSYFNRHYFEVPKVFHDSIISVSFLNP